MRMSALLMAVFALVALGCTGGGVPDPMPVEEGFHLPEGSPEAGREAFLELRCHICHAVPGDGTVPEPTSPRRGPAIDVDLAARSPASLAEGIIDPSHEIPPPRDSFVSPMGDYTHVLTVRQLIDLVAYIRDAGD